MEQGISTVNVKRTQEDYFAFSRQATKGIRNVRLYYLVAIVVMVIAIINGMEILDRHQWLPSALLKFKFTSLVLYCFIMWVGLLVMGKFFRPYMAREYLNDNQNFLHPKQMHINAAGIRETSDVSDVFYAWKGVDRIEKSKDFLLVFIDRLQAFCIPLRSFSTPQQANAFYENMLTYRAQATCPESSDISQ